VLARLAEATLRVMAISDCQSAMVRQGISPMPLGRAELPGFLRAETERWGAAVGAPIGRDCGIRRFVWATRRHHTAHMAAHGPDIASSKVPNKC